jgi:hypothetical protein
MGVGMQKRRKTAPRTPKPVPAHQPLADFTEGLNVFGLARHFGLPMQDALRKAAAQGWVETLRNEIRIFYPPNTNAAR